MTASQRLERILGETYLAALDERDVDELRRMRDECQEEESRVSFARRVLQGKLDIVRAEALRRRDQGGDVSDVLDALPEILGGDHHASDPMQARHTRFLVSSEAADEVGPVIATGDVRHLSAEELAELAAELGEREHELSTTRRQLFDRIDTIQAELVARYKSGAADIGDVIADRS